MNIIVMGTGEFAVPMLRELLASRHAVIALATQPARIPPGRKTAEVSPIKRLALEHGVEVLEPQDVNAAEAISELRLRGPELFAVAAYGQILSDELLGVASVAAINLHASLLPKYRGAAPVNWAIYHGERETGVTVIQMQPRVDAGPMLDQRSMVIGDDETAGELTARLAELGAPLVLQVIDELEAGKARPQVQDAALASRARKLRKMDGQIDWSRSARQIRDQVRALQPWPMAFTQWRPPPGADEALHLIVHRVAIVSSDAMSGQPPGSVVTVEGGRLEVQTGTGIVAIEELQPAGKRCMGVAEFLRGHAVRTGQQMG